MKQRERKLRKKQIARVNLLHGLCRQSPEYFHRPLVILSRRLFPPVTVAAMLTEMNCPEIFSFYIHQITKERTNAEAIDSQKARQASEAQDRAEAERRERERIERHTVSSGAEC